MYNLRVACRLPQLTSLRINFEEMSSLEPQGMNAAGLRELHVAIPILETTWLGTLFNNAKNISFLSLNPWQRHGTAPEVYWRFLPKLR